MTGRDREDRFSLAVLHISMTLIVGALLVGLIAKAW